MRVPLGGDEKPRTVKVKSSDGVTTHLVSCLPGGLWTCTCPGFVHKSKCRHIKLVRARFAEDARLPGDLL
jgi:hypothetical protein